MNGAGEAQTPMLVGRAQLRGQVGSSDCSVEVQEMPRASMLVRVVHKVSVKPQLQCQSLVKVRV